MACFIVSLFLHGRHHNISSKIRKKNYVNCADMVEGNYKFLARCNSAGPDGITSSVTYSPMTVSVYDDRMRLYDHSATKYTPNQELYPVYLKLRPQVPICEEGF